MVKLGNNESQLAGNKFLLITLAQPSLLFILFGIVSYTVIHSEFRVFTPIKAVFLFAPYYLFWVIFAVISFLNEGTVFKMISRANVAEAARNPDSEYNQDWNFKYSFPFFILCVLILFIQLFFFKDYFGF